jgi:hypothetical protein
VIDWEHLARTLGTVNLGGENNKDLVSAERGSSTLGRRALEQLIDSDVWASAVDHYVRGGLGSELVRSVLWLVHPWAAMQRCHDIVKSSDNVEARRSAVELLRVVADERALPFIRQLLQDKDPITQVWAAKTMDQLLWSGLVDVAQCQDLLEVMKNHINETVRDVAAEIRTLAADRTEVDHPDGPHRG